jgi:hypothetical protein
MNILKCLKANQLECENDFKLAIDGNSLRIESELGGSPLTTSMHRCLFDSATVLQVISNELVLNPIFVGSVLKHKDQKTFKYIIRNIIPLQSLTLTGINKRIVFQESHD